MWLIPLGLVIIGGYFWLKRSSGLSPQDATNIANQAMQTEQNPVELLAISKHLRKQGYANQADALLSKAMALNAMRGAAGLPLIPLV